MDPWISTSPMPFNFTQPDGEMMSIVAIQDQMAWNNPDLQWRHSRKLQERLDHLLVSLPLERHHEIGKLFHCDPAPVDELWIVPPSRILDVDLVVLAGEAQRIPLLLCPRYLLTRRMAALS